MSSREIYIEAERDKDDDNDNVDNDERTFINIWIAYGNI